MIELERKKTDELLFSFLENIYQFQQLEFKLFGLNWQQIYFLQILKKEEVKTVGDVSRKLNVEMFQASRIVSTLVEMNYISKIQDDIDKRSYKISISITGLEIIEKIEEFNFNTILKNIENIETNQIEVLIKSLNNLKKIIF